MAISTIVSLRSRPRFLVPDIDGPTAASQNYRAPLYSHLGGAYVMREDFQVGSEQFVSINYQGDTLDSFCHLSIGKELGSTCSSFLPPPPLRCRTIIMPLTSRTRSSALLLRAVQCKIIIFCPSPILQHAYQSPTHTSTQIPHSSHRSYPACTAPQTLPS